MKRLRVWSAPRRMNALDLDSAAVHAHASLLASTAVQQVIALASQLSEDERRLVVDAIAPKESVAELADLWQAELERRAERVRSGTSDGAPADEVFARIEAKLKNR